MCTALAAGSAAAAPIRIAVLQDSFNGSADAAGHVVAQLADSTAFNMVATHVTSGSLLDSAAELSAFDVVLIGDDGYGGNLDDWNLAGAAIKAWVTAGGALVSTAWTTYWPNLNADIASLLPVTGGYQYALDQGVDVNSTAHAITGGVSDFMSSGYQNYGTARSSATVLATAQGNPVAAAVAAWDYGAGRVVSLSSAYMLSRTGYGIGLNNLKTGDADRLLEQSVAWAANGSPVPEPGSLALVALALAVGAGVRRRVA